MDEVISLFPVFHFLRDKWQWISKLTFDPQTNISFCSPKFPRQIPEGLRRNLSLIVVVLCLIVPGIVNSSSLSGTNERPTKRTSFDWPRTTKVRGWRPLGLASTSYVITSSNKQIKSVIEYLSSSRTRQDNSEEVNTFLHINFSARYQLGKDDPRCTTSLEPVSHQFQDVPKCSISVRVAPKHPVQRDTKKERTTSCPHLETQKVIEEQKVITWHWPSSSPSGRNTEGMKKERGRSWAVRSILYATYARLLCVHTYNSKFEDKICLSSLTFLDRKGKEA